MGYPANRIRQRIIESDESGLRELLHELGEVEELTGLGRRKLIKLIVRNYYPELSDLLEDEKSA